MAHSPKSKNDPTSDETSKMLNFDSPAAAADTNLYHGHRRPAGREDGKGGRAGGSGAGERSEEDGAGGRRGRGKGRNWGGGTGNNLLYGTKSSRFEI